jgi:transcriptional regulator with XRE-family HTH domain
LLAGRLSTVADARETGERIAYHRKRLGLSQVEFASLIDRSESWVSQVERGVRAVDRLSVLQKVADALSVPVADLRGGTVGEGEEPSAKPEAFETLRLALTGHPAIDAVLGANGRTLTREHLDRLRKHETQVWPLVHASRYGELAPIVADLIPELEHAVRARSGPAEEARELLTDTYQAVAAMMAKLGETDAAWIAADRAAAAAEALDQPLAVAASLFRMAHVFLSLGQVAQAQAVANGAVDALQQRVATEPSPEAISLCGAFHLVLAIAAARDNDRTQANQHLDQARALADRLSEDRDDFGTEFGPTNVALHAVGVAVELGDAGHALDLARDIDPRELSPERQARYLIDVAQAHAMRRQIGEALHCLEEAERITPEQTRGHRVARAVARDLIQLSGTRPRAELRELAERFGVWP